MYSPDPARVHAAHSIYFQALGEQGWIGLFLFLSIGVATWLACAKMRKLGSGDAELRWAHDLGSMVQVSMVGYAAAGAFLSLTWFDLPYNQMIIATIGLRLAQAQLASRTAVAAAAASPPRPPAGSGRRGPGSRPAHAPLGRQPAALPPQPGPRP